MIENFDKFNELTEIKLKDEDCDEICDFQESDDLEEFMQSEKTSGFNDDLELKTHKNNFDDIRFDGNVGVYVKVNSQGFITDIDSDIFIKDFSGWQKIDEGEGDKYVYAQTQYFGSLFDEKGNYKFKKQ